MTNLADITIGAGKRDVYTFPDKSNTAPDWVKSTKTSIVIQGEAFKGLSNIILLHKTYQFTLIIQNL
jgi:hypothetical protein